MHNMCSHSTQIYIICEIKGFGGREYKNYVFPGCDV